MQEIVSVIFDNGIGVGCLLYFMWFNSTTMKKNNELLSSMDKRLSIIEKCLGLDKKVDE